LKFSITQKDIKVDEHVAAFLEEKLDKLDAKFKVKINTVAVVLQKKKYLYYAELRVPAKNVLVVGEGESDTSVYAALEQSITKVEAQLHKHKDKVKNRKSKASLAHKEDVQSLDESIESDEADEMDDEVSLDEKVDVEARVLKPMSIEEAALQMDMVSEKLFDVFVNSKTNEVNVIYRKSNTEYGVIIQKK